MSAVVRLNVGTKDSPQYLYYAGYHKNGYPLGPILVEQFDQAMVLEGRVNAERVIAGDERLRVAPEIIEF